MPENGLREPIKIDTGSVSIDRSKWAQGLKLVRTGVFLFLLRSILVLIGTILVERLFSSSGRLLLGFVIFVLIGLLFLALEISALVVIIIGTRKLQKMDLSGYPGYKKDLDISLASIFLYILFQILTPIFSNTLTGFFLFLEGSDLLILNIILQSLMELFALVSIMSLLVALGLPVWKLVLGRTRDLLLVSAAVFILNRFLFNGYLFIGNIMVASGHASALKGSEVLGYLFQIINIAGFILILIVYNDRINVLLGRKMDLGPEMDKRIRKDGLVNKLEGAISRRPYRALGVLIAIGLMFSLALGITEYVSFGKFLQSREIDRSMVRGDLEQRSVNRTIQNFSDYLSDGEEQTVDLSIRGPVLDIEVVLTWSDEQAGPTWTNRPDGFSLEVEVKEEETDETIDKDSKSGENDESGEGALEISFSWSMDDPGPVSILRVIVTLEMTGEYEGKLLGLRTRPDESNSYSLMVFYSYLVEED